MLVKYSTKINILEYQNRFPDEHSEKKQKMQKKFINDVRVVCQSK